MRLQQLHRSRDWLPGLSEQYHPDCALDARFARVGGQYTEFCTPYAGLSKVLRPDGAYRANQRFSLYRWHIADPIRFETDLAVTIQALGWRSGGRYLPLQDDISSVAYWYQTLPASPFPALPDYDGLEII